MTAYFLAAVVIALILFLLVLAGSINSLIQKAYKSGYTQGKTCEQHKFLKTIKQKDLYLYKQCRKALNVSNEEE